MSGGKIAIVIVLIILMISILGAVGYMMYNPKPSSTLPAYTPPPVYNPPPAYIPPVYNPPPKPSPPPPKPSPPPPKPSPPSTPVRTYLGIIGQKKGTAVPFNCSEGNYIKQFVGNSGAWVDTITAICSDGKRSSKIGTSTGGRYGTSRMGPFTSVNATSAGDLLYTVNGFGGRAGPTKLTKSCPSSQRITGIIGYGNQYARGMDFYCS